MILLFTVCSRKKVLHHRLSTSYSLGPHVSVVPVLSLIPATQIFVQNFQD